MSRRRPPPLPPRPRLDFGRRVRRHAHPAGPACSGVHFRSVLRFASGFFSTRPRGARAGVSRRHLPACSCLRLAVATNSPREGLSPPIQCPCQAHLHSSGLSGATSSPDGGQNWTPIGGALPHQKCYRRTDRQAWGGDTESDRCRRWRDRSAWARGARSSRRWRSATGRRGGRRRGGFSTSCAR